MWKDFSSLSQKKISWLPPFPSFSFRWTLPERTKNVTRPGRTGKKFPRKLLSAHNYSMLLHPFLLSLLPSRHNNIPQDVLRWRRLTITLLPLYQCENCRSFSLCSIGSLVVPRKVFFLSFGLWKSLENKSRWVFGQESGKDWNVTLLPLSSLHPELILVAIFHLSTRQSTPMKTFMITIVCFCMGKGFFGTENVLKKDGKVFRVV